MKKLYFIMFLGLILLPMSAKAATTMPAPVDGKITLTDDVTLSDKFVVQSGETLTIDLNGHTITGSNHDFAIYNLGTATIVDNGSPKGKVYCRTPDGAQISCIRNDSTMTIKGVTVDASYIAIKNNSSASTLTIDDSNISAITETALLNYGTVTVNNSHIKTESKKGAVAFDCDKSGAKSITNINNSTLEGTYVLQNGTDDKYTKRDLNINSIELKGSTPRALFLGPRVVTIKVSGDNKANAGTHSLAFLSNRAPSGSTVTLTEDTSATLTVPAGATLIVPEGVTLDVASSITVKGNLDVKGTLNANAYNEGMKKYYKSLSEAVSKAKDGDKVTLQNDVSQSSLTTKANKNVTLDLNGKTFTGNITNVANGNLTIKDSSEDKTGKVDGTITNNGVLNIESGKYTSAPVTSTDAQTNITGGIYPVDNIDDANIPENMELTSNGDGTYSLALKKADYTKVDEALEKANKIDRKKYTSKSLKTLDETVKNVERDKNITEQAEVDKMAKDILEALNKLEEKPVIKNPKTYDKSGIYATLSLMSFLGIAITYRKICKVG